MAEGISHTLIYDNYLSRTRFIIAGKAVTCVDVEVYCVGVLILQITPKTNSSLSGYVY